MFFVPATWLNGAMSTHCTLSGNRLITTENGQRTERTLPRLPARTPARITQACRGNGPCVTHRPCVTECIMTVWI